MSDQTSPTANNYQSGGAMNVVCHRSCLRKGVYNQHPSISYDNMKTRIHAKTINTWQVTQEGALTHIRVMSLLFL